LFATNTTSCALAPDHEASDANSSIRQRALHIDPRPKKHERAKS
jgi:hypothetical protein